MSEGEQASKEHAGAVGHERRDRVVLDHKAQDYPPVDRAQDCAHEGKRWPREETEGIHQLFRSSLCQKHRDASDEAEAQPNPFAGVHLFIEVQPREEGSKEWGEAVDETGLGGREILKPPEFECIGQIDAKESQKSQREDLDPVQPEGRTLEERQKSKKQHSRKDHARARQKQGRAVLQGHLAQGKDAGPDGIHKNDDEDRHGSW